MVSSRYTQTAIWLHWIIAIGIIANIALAWTWDSLPASQIRPAIDLHKSIGITILGLAILRLLWRFTHQPPTFPTAYKQWEITLSHIAHWALYAVLFIMPLTGWIMDSAYKDAASHPMFLFGLFQWPRLGFIMALDPATKKTIHDSFGAAHGICAKIVYVLFAAHVLGAFKHQFLDKERELQRMWFWGKTE
jgi:cytochrome b561